MANQKYVHETEIQMGDGADPEVFTAIGGIEGDIPFPELDSELLDITARDSPNNRREWGSGLEDSPEMQITIFWDPEDDKHEALIDAQRDKTTHNYKFVAPGGFDEWTVAMVVRRFAPRSPSGGYMRADVTFKPTGDITREAPAA